MTVTNKFTEFAGELGCVDVYHQSVELIHIGDTNYYLFGIMDSCTQIVWVELLEESDPLTIMFATLKCFTIFSDYYNIKFKDLLSNGSLKKILEADSNTNKPFTRLLNEKGIAHKTSEESSYANILNSNIKEFWSCLHLDVLKGTIYEDREDLKNKIVSYLYYYNEKRVHKNLRGMTPTEFNKVCPRHL